MTDQVSADPRIGTELAGYRIERLLGRGGMSVVYLAHDPRLKRNVALKLLAPELAEDERFRERFLRESQLAASLDHPNVIPIFEAGEAGGVLFIAMRFVEGSDLKRLLAEEGRLEPVRAVGILERVADALDAAHRRGLVHRDVKPGNVLISGAGHVYLSDFGLTKQAGSESGVTETGQFVGTADYVAPEQIERREVSGATDEYSLACVLYECLTGGPPFRGESLMGTLFGHVNDEAASVSQANPELPAEADAVLSRGMAKEPEERYATCGALVEDARSALGVSGEVAVGGMVRPKGRWVWGGAAVVAVLVAAAVVLGVLLVGGGGDDAVVGDDWSRVPHNEATFGGTLGTHAVSLASGSSGLVAVGSEGRVPDESSDVAVWTSSDGLAWTKVSDPDLSGSMSEFANGVTAGSAGFVAVGNVAGDLNDVLSADAAVWRSSDGREWERVVGSEDALGGENSQLMEDVVVGGPGFVAVGYEFPGGGAVWTSPDGSIWSRVEDDPAVFGASVPVEVPFVIMAGVALASDGRIVAVGSDWLVLPGGLDSSGIGVAWVSTDGVSWIRATHDDQVFGDGSTALGLDDVAAGGPGFVAVGFESSGGVEPFLNEVLRTPSELTLGPESGEAVVVTSVDGLSWSRIPNEQLPGGGENVALVAVEAVEGGFVAAGWRREEYRVRDAGIDAVVWNSADGLTWVEAVDPEGALRQPGGQLIADVAQGGPGLVAIGQDGDSRGFNTAIWTSP